VHNGPYLEIAVWGSGRVLDWDNYCLKLADMLAANRLMRTQEEIDRYIAALNVLGHLRPTRLKTDCLEALFYGFDDSTEHIPPMQSLVAYLHGVQGEILATTVLRIVHKHIDRASWWLEHFCLGFLVSPSDEEIFRREYCRLSDIQKSSIDTLLWRVLKWYRDEEEEYRDVERRIHELLGGDRR
jgi:hypothetical protein